MDPDTPNFDSVARAYRWMEYASFGPMLERCRFHFLPQSSAARHALVLGDGDGRFTARLLASNPTVQVDAVDASPAMLDILRQRARNNCQNAETRLSTTQADIRHFTPPGNDYDLVVSHFFLDCLTDEEVHALVARICPSMTPDAIWLVSEFAVPPRGWKRVAARTLIRCLYFAFSVLTGLRIRHIPDYAKSLNDNGFHPVDRVAFLGGLLAAELWKPPSG
ncbi:MAG: class I SAM-dependent methyltransferase [Acidobacteriota bacterium]